MYSWTLKFIGGDLVQVVAVVSPQNLFVLFGEGYSVERKVMGCNLKVFNSNSKSIPFGLISTTSLVDMSTLIVFNKYLFEMKTNFDTWNENDKLTLIQSCADFNI